MTDDYASDYGYPVDDPRFLNETGFARNRVYEPASRVHVRPPPAVAERAPRMQRTNVDALPDVLHAIADGWATFPGRILEPMPVRSGHRTLLSVKESDGGKWFYAVFRCDCGMSGWVRSDTWKNSAHDAACRSCNSSRARTFAVESKAARAARLATPAYHTRGRGR